MVKIYLRGSVVIAPGAIPSKSIINTHSHGERESKRELKIPNKATIDQAMATNQHKLGS